MLWFPTFLLFVIILGGNYLESDRLTFEKNKTNSLKEMKRINIDDTKHTRWPLYEGLGHWIQTWQADYTRRLDPLTFACYLFFLFPASFSVEISWANWNNPRIFFKETTNFFFLVISRCPPPFRSDQLLPWKMFRACRSLTESLELDLKTRSYCRKLKEWIRIKTDFCETVIFQGNHFN